jgi:hypothetical protein
MTGIQTKMKIDNIQKLMKNLARNEINSAVDDTLKEMSDMWYEDAHEITGFMKSRISYTSTAMHGRVFCDADYAKAENDRGGLHEFTRRGNFSGPAILKAKLEELLSI